MQNETALSIFRAYNGYPSQKEGFYAGLIAQHLEDKTISKDTIRYMATQKIQIGSFLRETLLRSRGTLSNSDMDFLFKMIYSGSNIDDLTLETYDGSPEQNKVIDFALTLYNDAQLFIGENAMVNYLPSKNIIANAPQVFRNIPIAVIGRGPAGVMVNAALRLIGFQNVQTFDKRGSALGIWGQPNVAGGTKNNPRHFDFGGFAALPSAKGDGTRDAVTVVEFVRAIGRRYDLYDEAPKTNVTKVVPGDLNHIVHYEDENKQSTFSEFAIVINCVGTGKPRDFNDTERMSLLPKTKRPIAVRWQQKLEAKDVKDKRFAFIGLGNSTAEMISQLNEHRNAGVDCDYKIFTHYPQDAVFNPTDSVEDADGRMFRMFRDLSKPDLTGFQGDLPRARQDYMRSLREERIVSDVTSWGVNESGNKLLTAEGDYRFDKLFVLTGYEQDTKELEEKFGLDCSAGYPAADYDGEFRDASVLHRGYFGLGALMDSSHDRNAVVMPGMMFRIPDMMFTVVCRAAEYAAKKANSA